MSFYLAVWAQMVLKVAEAYVAHVITKPTRSRWRLLLFAFAGWRRFRLPIFGSFQKLFLECTSTTLAVTCSTTFVSFFGFTNRMYSSASLWTVTEDSVPILFSNLSRYSASLGDLTPHTKIGHLNWSLLSSCSLKRSHSWFTSPAYVTMSSPPPFSIWRHFDLVLDNEAFGSNMCANISAVPLISRILGQNEAALLCMSRCAQFTEQQSCTGGIVKVSTTYLEHIFTFVIPSVKRESIVRVIIKFLNAPFQVFGRRTCFALFLLSCCRDFQQFLLSR